MCNPLGYDRPLTSFIYKIKPGLGAPYLFLFALSRRCTLKLRLLGIPILSHPSRSSPAWSLIRPHSASLAPTSVVFKNLSSGVTAFSFASKLASHLLSA